MRFTCALPRAAALLLVLAGHAGAVVMVEGGVQTAPCDGARAP